MGWFNHQLENFPAGSEKAGDKVRAIKLNHRFIIDEMVGPGRLGFPSIRERVRQCNYCVVSIFSSRPRFICSEDVGWFSCCWATQTRTCVFSFLEGFRRLNKNKFLTFAKLYVAKERLRRHLLFFTSKKLNWVVVANTHMFQRVETTNFRKEDVQNIRLKLTASKCSETGPLAPKRKGKYSNHPFSRSNLPS